MPRLRCSQSTAGLFSHAVRLTQISFCPPAAAANQREALKSPFHLKEEPKVEEALSPRPASRSQSQIQPSFAAAFSQHGSAAGAAAVAAAERPMLVKPREGSPMAKNSLLSQDINMKVASELLMKLSGKDYTEILANKSNQLPFVHIRLDTSKTYDRKLLMLL